MRGEAPIAWALPGSRERWTDPNRYPTPFRDYTEQERAELYRRHCTLPKSAAPALTEKELAELGDLGKWLGGADRLNATIQRLRQKEHEPIPVLPALPRVPPGERDHARDATIEANMTVVQTIVGKLLRGRQNTTLEKDDLLQVGYLEMIHSVDRPAVGELPLDKRIARNASTAIFRFIAKDLREKRYSQRGSQKAIRDTDTGNQAGDVDGGIGSDGRSRWEDGNTAPARIPLSVKNRDFPNSDEFVYRRWLRGTVSVFRETFIVPGPDGHPRLSHTYSFMDLAPQEFYIRPVLDNISRRETVFTDPHPAFPWESSWHRPGTTWKISEKSGVREIRLHRPRGSESRAARTVQKWDQTIGPVRAGSVVGLPKYGYAEWAAWRRAMWRDVIGVVRRCRNLLSICQIGCDPRTLIARLREFNIR